MGKMKKILAILCIATVAAVCLPGLKFLTHAETADYWQSVIVEYGKDVTLTLDYSKLPSGFQVSEVKWSNGEQTGKTYTLKNVKKSDFVSANVWNKDKSEVKTYYFQISVENKLKAVSVGAENQSVAYGKTVTLQVKASCKRGKLTYRWFKKDKNSYYKEVKSGETVTKFTTDKITEQMEYNCTVEDQYGNQKTIHFNIGVDNDLSIDAVGKTEIIADAGEKLTLKVKASCKTGKLTSSWSSYQNGVTKELGSGTSVTCKAPDRSNGDVVSDWYTCRVTDQYNNTDRVSFKIYVFNKLNKNLNDKKIILVSGNQEMDGMKDIVAKKYPSYTKNIEYLNLETGSSSVLYYDLVQNIIKEYPNNTIIVVMDTDAMERFLSTGEFMDMDKLGLTEAYSQSYPYTRKIGTYKGKLTAVTPYITSGTFMYDPDIAKKVLGTSNPDKVQKMIGTVDGYLQVAAKMKKAGYYMTSGALNDDGVSYSLKDGILYRLIGDVSDADDYDYARNYMVSEADKKIVKKIIDATTANRYDTGSTMWAEDWHDDMESGKVFGWFSSTWASRYSITFDKSMAVCQGPISYSWGGSYLAVKSGKQDEAAAQFLKALCCDSDIQSKLTVSTTPNNTTVMKKLISKGTNPTGMNGKPVAMINNQNLYEAFDEMARSLDGGSYKISKPKVSLTGNGIVKGTDGKYYYAKNGLIQSANTGFVKVGKKTYYIKKGVMQNKKTGFVKYGKKKYYVKKGVCSTKNEFVKVGKKTYYLNKGVKNTKTGFVKVGKATYYVKNGLKTNKTAFIKNGKKTCYVKNGVWKKSYTGKVIYQKHVYYVKKGIKVKKVR